MQRTFVCLVALGALAASPAARADSPPAAPAPDVEAQPPAPEPNQAPPPPVFANPPPPYAQPIEGPPPPVQAAQPAPPPAGQWVYTQQYGWLWMPYDQAYTQVVDNAALAYEYVYYPTFGWRWVVAPWVLGFGMAPHWGRLGPAHFVWYAHPWFRVGTAHLRPSWGRVVAPRGLGGSGHFGRHGHR